MLLPSISKPAWLSLIFLVAIAPFTNAIRLIESKSLNPCQDNSSFTATLFNVIFTPDNGSLAFDIVGVSSINGLVTAEIDATAYGYSALKKSIDPCKENLEGMCPMRPGQINIKSNIDVSMDNVRQIPGIAYTIPDLDGLVKIYVKDQQTGQNLACVEAQLSNGKTVDLAAVGWATAAIAGLALLASAVTSGLGHSNTAAHVAANALSLFGFFQAQAIIGMTAVPLPPIVASWTQNFQWSLGIIRVGFLQSICTWYQRSTGGTPSTLLSNLTTASVAVQKRSLGAARVVSRAVVEFVRRTGSQIGNNSQSAGQVVVVSGIKRVGFRAKIESTNIFLTGLILFIVFVALTALCVALFKAFCEVAVKAGWFKGDKFEDFRTGWKVVLKGILFRLVSRDIEEVVSCDLTLCSGADWVSSNLHPLLVGAHSTRLCRRSRSRPVLLRFDDDCTGVGFLQGFQNCETLRLHAQESSIHSLLRPFRSQQMGLPLCPIPSHRVLRHHSTAHLHFDQRHLHCLCTR